MRSRTGDDPREAAPGGATAPAWTAPAYERLGVRRVVNASDTLTVLGGGRLSPGVLAAMAEGARHHVDVAELLAASGRHLARLTRNEAALVVGGAAAGLAVAAAACMAGTDRAALDALPRHRGPKREVVLLRCQRNPYDRALLQAGAEVVEVGYFDATYDWQLAAVLSERTAAVVWFAGTLYEQGALPLPDVVRVAHAAGVPVVVDAAAQLPPVENLWRYTCDEGADLVIFSGGKGLRGPQASGLLLGSAELVAAAAANSFPRHSTGRAMKTSKENVLGLVTAVEEALATDRYADRARWEAMVARVIAELGALPGLRAWRVGEGRLGQAYPRAYVAWSSPERDGGPPAEPAGAPLAAAPTAAEIAAALRGRDPAVHVGHDDPAARAVYVNPFSLLDDELDVVLDALRAVLPTGRNRP